MIDETHDPNRGSWVETAAGHPQFPAQNLPLGIFSEARGRPRPGAAIGDYIVDLAGAVDAGLLSEFPPEDLSGGTLNAVMAWPPAERAALRRAISDSVCDRRFEGLARPLLHHQRNCTLHLPAAIGDYTDFYAGIHHATNVGRQFRPANPLLPNYKYMPIGYHGRASSVRPSEVPVIRPRGQRLRAGSEMPEFGPTTRLDFELELGIWIAGGNALGRPIDIGDAAGHIAGLCLLNDWSARDIQAWEYQPLGPFLAKSFHTTVSPWVVTAEALEPFRIAQAPRAAEDPRPLPHLWSDQDQATGAFNIRFEVGLSSQRMREASLPPQRLSSVCASQLYWTVAQMIAHHASNGCNLRPADLLGSGTISGPAADTLGSLLEMTQGGSQPIALPAGESRTFLADGDEIVISAVATAPNRVPIGFGTCRASIAPAVDS
ncbi:MAG: fumarylacetoacetase [Steroidobacteraceae bacterium]